MKEGPMKKHIEQSDEGVIKAEFITYRKKNGMLVKETTVRKFQEDGDYHDSYTDEPIVSL